MAKQHFEQVVCCLIGSNSWNKDLCGWVLASIPRRLFPYWNLRRGRKRGSAKGYKRRQRLFENQVTDAVIAVAADEVERNGAVGAQR